MAAENSVLDFAGAWKGTDEEWNRIRAELEALWSVSRIPRDFCFSVKTRLAKKRCAREDYAPLSEFGKDNG